MALTLWQLLFLMIPAYVANMSPVLVSGKWWSAPIDGGLTWNGKRLLGKNKTWRGLVVGTGDAIIMTVVLSWLYWPFAFSPWVWGALAGAGALLGDALASFFKRRLDLPPGSPWIPFDQIDYSVGALALGSLVFVPGWLNALVIVAISAIGHIGVNHVAYYIGIRKVRW